MKTSNKSTLITGIILLLIAAIFSISLILQALDFGIAGPTHNNIFYMLGNVIFSVYGFSSILIPVFMFVAGISCFATTWSARKTMRLLTAVIPFFTAVVTENTCRSILALQSSSFPGVKVFVAVITGVMLIIIEVLGAGILADKINPILFGKKSEPAEKPVKPEENKDSIIIEENGKITSSENKNPANHFDTSIGKLNTENLLFGKNEKSSDSEIQELLPEDFDKMESVKESTSKTEAVEKTETVLETKEAVFEEKTTEEKTTEEQTTEEKITETNKENDEIFSLEEEKSTDEEKSNENENSVKIEVTPEVKQQVSSVFDAALSEVKTEDFHLENNDEYVPENADAEIDELVKDYDETDGDEHDETYEDESVAFSDELNDCEPAAPLISQEEYAALTDFGNDTNDDSSEEDELVWNNLPPKQDKLPKDYDEDYSEDFDENDPDLEFPPKDEAKNDVKNSEDDPFSAFDVDLDSESEINKEPENPYSAARYIDSVVENPNFGHGITLRDGSEPLETEEEKKTLEREEPKFPSKISLDDSDDDLDDNYEEDVTLPFPDMPAEPSVSEKYKNDFSESDGDEADEGTTIIPSLNNAKETSKEISVEEKISNAAKTSSALYQASGNEASPFNLSDVFSDMENDIRRESYKKLSEETQQAYERGELTEKTDASENNIERDDDFEDENIEDNAASEAIDDPIMQEISEFEANNNLVENEEDEDLENPDVDFEENSISETASEDIDDESDAEEDFFEIQSKKNAPVTQEIAANPPKIGNRAVKKGPYVIPSDLLTAYQDDQYWIIDDATKQASLNLKQTLAEFNIEAQIIGIKKGPVVTMFELLPAPGVKLSKIVQLQDNIALSLAAQSVRIVAPIPGKQAVGIEVPNRHRSIVGFREIIEMKLDEWTKMAVPVILGKDILGKAQLIDLVKTPHMLIAGATGSGKSVCVNSLILSILYKRSFRDVKLILVDPKVVELKLYNNIPHLLTPVITEPKKAIQALQWCLCEMERRYALLDSMGVRDISSYNVKIKEREIATEKLPYIVVIIDEFADLMATSGKELESIVARLTAMSRAVGIHLVLATQRPSVNVITGLIKANIPSRIAFMVASRTDSNIIIDSVGAEKLLGRGDMLYASAVDPYPVRIQGTFVSDQEVEDVVRTVKEYGEPDYIDDQMFTDDEDNDNDDFELNGNYDVDPLYDQALEIVIQAGKASASYLQRRLSIGYNRAARLVEEMEERGIVGPANGSKPREILHLPG